MERSSVVSTRPQAPTHRNIVVVAALLAASLFGCDTATDDDTIVLSDLRAAFVFEFDDQDVQVGVLQDITSNQEVSLASQLANRGGFTLAEVVTARVSSASIELVVPTFVGSGVDLRFLDEVVLQLRSGSTREVASRVGFTDQEPANLNVIEGRDVSAIVKSGSFSGVLLVEPNNLIDTNYQMEVVAEFTVEVEGGLAKRGP